MLTRNCEVEFLLALTDRGLTLRLYKSDTEPSDAPRLTEADFRGYAPARLAAADWSIAAGKGDAPSVATSEDREFASTAQQPEQLIFGYYVTRGPFVLSVVRFPDGPYPVRNKGDAITVGARIEQRRVAE